MDGDIAPHGRLLVCPTPIGNLQDVTLRVLEALSRAEVIACEDTRRTGLLLQRHGLRRPGTVLMSLHEHNERGRAEELLRRVREGRTVALLSDAGMPLISDPGFPLVSAAIEQGLPVEVLPGPSAVLTALLASGLPAERFRFEGFLPRSRGELERVLRQTGATLIAFESPKRVAASVQVLAAIDPDRRVAVCRELTKLHEEVIRGSAAELARRLSGGQLRGEVVLVMEGAEPEGAQRMQDALEAVSELIRSGARPRAAARAIARLTGVSANELYERAAGGGAALSGGGGGA